MELFTASYSWISPVRSLSMRVIDLVTDNGCMELSLFEDNEKEIARENLAHAIDGIRKRLGHGAVLKASCLLDSKLTDFNPKEDHTIHPVPYFR